MAYRIKFERRAKEELTRAQDTYGTDFREESNGWLKQLAYEAERQTYSISIDTQELAESALEALEKKTDWQYSWRRLLNSSWKTKLRALLAVVKKRRPPYEQRSAPGRFVILGSFDADVTAHFEIDHAQKCVIFRLFDGLPGEE